VRHPLSAGTAEFDCLALLLTEWRTRVTRTLPVTLSAVALLAGCADSNIKAEPMQEREHLTGSNIPRRDKDRSALSTVSREEFEQLRQSRGTTMAPTGQGR
jgi:hypothetical protein